MVIASFLDNGFGANLSSKANVMSVWKEYFLFFLQIFEWLTWNAFVGKWGKVLKSI